MNINSQRIDDFLKDYIKDNLSNGYMPSASEIIIALTNYRANLKDGQPSIEPNIDFENINISIWNKIKLDIIQDLKLIYKVLIANQVEIEQLDLFNNLEKQRLRHRMNELKESAEITLNQLRSNQYSYIDSFKDFLKIGSTSCFVDIVNGCISNPILHSESEEKIVLNIASNGVFKSKDPNNNILSDGLIWNAQIEKESQEETYVSLEIELARETEISDVSIDCLMLKPIQVLTTISPDGVNWEQLEKSKVITSARLPIHKTIKKIKIYLIKEEADKKSLSKFIYSFIIKNLVVNKTRYALESVLTSVDIPISNKNLLSIDLEANEYLPIGTNIKYSLKVDDSIINLKPKGSYGYTGPHTLYGEEALNIIEIKQDGNLSENALYRPHLSNGTQKAFEIYNGQIGSNLKLFKGFNSWKVENINIEELTIPNLTYFLLNNHLVSTYYLPIENKIGNINHSPKLSGINKYSFNFNNTGKDYDLIKKITGSNFKLYVNGELVNVSNQSYTIHIRKGQNEIIVLSLSPLSGVDIDIGLTNLDIPFDVFAEKKQMKEVSKLDFQFGTYNDYNVFFTEIENEKISICVKDSNLDIIYGLKYSIKPEEIKNLKLEIKLSSESENITPKLDGYKLHFLS